jgi:hypothetical protein
VFDIHLYSLNLDNGQELPDLPGTLTVTPPKKTVHGRNADIVNILLTISGNAPFTSDYMQNILKQIAGVYFSTPGSVTYAIRSAIEYLNNLLLQRNLKSSREGIQAIGTLNFAILHEENLFIAHSGQTHSYLLRGNQVQDYSDESTTDRGLGVSKGVTPRFFQTDLKPNDLLIMCVKPPAAWSDENLAGASSLNLESLRRRLINQAGANLQAQVIRFISGKGLVFRRKLVEAAPVATPVKPATPEIETDSSKTEPDQVSPSLTQTGQKPAQPVQQSLPIESINSLDQVLSTGLPEKGFLTISDNTAAVQEKTDEPLSPREKRLQKRQQPKQPSKIKNSLAKAWLTGRDFKRKVDTGTQKVTSKVIPKLAVRKPTVSPSLMLFIAIAIPIIIVAIATTIYIQRGRSAQHNYFVQQSQLSVNYALETEDLKAKIAYWEAALSFIDQAETFGVEKDSQDRRTVIQQNLDMLGGMSHLTIKPALTEKLPTSMNITKFVTTMNDTSNVFFLDSNAGQVLHMTRQDQNAYVMDSTFNCNPTSVNPAISPLIDVQALPPNAIELEANSAGGASVVAIDSKGNLMYCAPGKKPLVVALPVPDVGWGEIQHITLDSGSLCVLDSRNRRVWIYEGENYIFKTAPYLFFDSQVPSNMADIKGMAVNNLELFLLHQDSQMTQCTYSAFKKLKLTECKDPAVYMDLRTSTTPIPFAITGLKYIQMEKQDLPDSALYILDASANALYKFGYQLNLFHVFHFRPDPDYPSPSQPISGFGLTAERTVFFAFGNEIYFAELR